MKQYTTPLIAVKVTGQELLLKGADRVVVSMKNGSKENTIDGVRLKIDGDTITFRLTTSETAAMIGLSNVEVTIFTGDLVYKTKTAKLKINEAVWKNGD